MIDHIPLEDLSALMDGALPAARQAQVEAHLSTCEACREEFDSLAWADRFLAAMPDVEPPPSERFHIPVEEPEAGSQAGPLLMPRFDRSWVGLGAIAAMVTIAFLLGQLTGDARFSAMESGEEEAVAESAAEFDADAVEESADAADEGEVESVADAESDAVALDVAADAVVNSEAESVEDSTGDAADDAEPAPLSRTDAAAKQARERIAEGDDAEDRVEPLGTAIRADRDDLVAGDESSEPSAALVLGTPETLEGGYKPPGAEIPGVISARDLIQIGPITATQIAAAVATAERVLTQAPPPSDATAEAPAKAAQATVDAARIFVTPPVLAFGAADAGPTAPADPAAAEDPAEVAAEGEASEEEAASTTQNLETTNDGMPTEVVEEDAMDDSSRAFDPDTAVAPDSELPTSVDGAEDSNASEAAPRALILPLAAVSVGLLALGLLLLRQARRRSRRHRNRMRDR